MDSRESHGSSADIASLTSSPQPTTSDSWPPLRGYAYNFVETPPTKYCCGVCSLPLREAHQTGCGHRLCRSCADGLLTETNPQCPECSEPLDRKQVYRDTCCNREILNLHVFCPNEASGCCETMVLHKLLVHLDTCPYELVACHNDACSMHLARLYMPQHHGTCPFRLEFCKFCSAPVPCAQLEEHKQTCPKYLLPCPNNCDEHGIPRNELEKHLVQCALTEQPCSFHRFGCDFKACGKGVAEHEAGSVPQHLLLVLRKHTELQETLGQVQGELEQKASVFEQMQLRLERAESDAEHWGKLVSKNEASLTSTVEKVTAQTKRVQVLEKLWESGNGLSTMRLESSRSRECYDDLKGVQQMLEVVKTRLSTLESLESTVGTMEKTLQTHESLLPVHTQRLADTDLRFQLLETVSSSGRLVWKLTDYAQRKLDATTGITPSLYSQPFYTTTFGYKMCARVYLNGDGVGRGTHLSLFFVVMRGEYDTILSWPFRQRVTLMLLDQGPGRKHLSDTFKPDPASSSFKRPTSEMNVASGCPMFVSHGVLESRTYLKDDSIFLSIVVDRTGLDDL